MTARKKKRRLPNPTALVLDWATTCGLGILGDIEKYNEACLRDWLVIRATPSQVRSRVAFGWLFRAFGNAFLGNEK